MSEAPGSQGGGPGAARTADRRDVALAWALVALWTAVVASLSSRGFSAEWSRSRFVGPLMELLGLSREAAEIAHFCIRKAAHVAEYAVLGALAARAAGLSLPRRGVLPAALGLALAVAAGDEFHQAHGASRVGSPRDVALDLGVAALGVAVWRTVRRSAPQHRAP